MFKAADSDPEDKIFEVHITSLIISNTNEVYPFHRAPIALLKDNKAPTIVPLKYSNFAIVFSLKLVAELLKHTKSNNYAIDLVDGKKPCYGQIYSTGPVEWETWKISIENNLAHGFIAFRILCKCFNFICLKAWLRFLSIYWLLRS